MVPLKLYFSYVEFNEKLKKKNFSSLLPTSPKFFDKMVKKIINKQIWVQHL